ncbi:protein MKS1-like [Lathyrus oleraceus]|uniref:protein MKS1-like n=1 Tax=Pisum sativum TaxID=3888 RepID=UPI001FC5D463|nr:protein MKS1-like [Pisum sativum]
MKVQNSLNRERPLSRQNSLKLNKESHKIIKNAPLQIPQSRVIIYSLPQRVANVTSPQDFKDVVHTGNGQPTAASEVSPAARLASTERTKKKEKPSWSTGDDDMMRMLEDGVQMSQFPGILLPEPARLPPLSPQNFSPITWPVTPTDAFSQIFPSTPETLQQKPIGVFSPVLSPQSQTVLSYNDVWPENNAFAKPSEFHSPEVGLPQSPPSPPIQFNPFNYD